MKRRHAAIEEDPSADNLLLPEGDPLNFGEEDEGLPQFMSKEEEPGDELMEPAPFDGYEPEEQAEEGEGGEGEGEGEGGEEGGEGEEEGEGQGELEEVEDLEGDFEQPAATLSGAEEEEVEQEEQEEEHEEQEEEHEEEHEEREEEHEDQDEDMDAAPAGKTIASFGRYGENEGEEEDEEEDEEDEDEEGRSPNKNRAMAVDGKEKFPKIHKASETAQIGKEVAHKTEKVGKAPTKEKASSEKRPQKRNRLVESDPKKESDEDEDDEEEDDDDDDDEKGEGKKRKEAQSSLEEQGKKFAANEEAQGIIEFKVIGNDGTRENVELLTGAKNIFQKQLPKMPKEYITRLVYDVKHMTMVIVKGNTKVIGAITYRAFGPKDFAEIVFCAVHSDNQVRGYGSLLMSHLKDYITTCTHIKYFLTYADNYAVGYFKKQGFTTDLTLDKSHWGGYIKDYDGGTLMLCTIVQNIKHTEVKDMVAKQRALIGEKIKQYSLSNVSHPGLTSFKANPTPAQILAIPGVAEAGWKEEMSRNKRGPQSSLNAFLTNILSLLKKHSFAWPFEKPVNKDDVADYYDIVKEPMDLKTVEERLNSKYYRNREMFADDVTKIFVNCRAYNGPETVYVKCANGLEEYFKRQLNKNPNDPDTH